MYLPKVLRLYSFQPRDKVFINSHSTFNLNTNYIALHLRSVAAAPAQSQLKPEAEPSLAEAQPELPSDGSHISANSSSG